MNEVYSLVTIPPARKSLKKLPSHIRSRIIDSLEILATEPMKGEQLHPPFERFRSFHLSLSGSQYRVMYAVEQSNQEIVIYYAGTRENFYKEARRLNLKYIA